MKNPYQLGREARDRDICSSLNPYWNRWERKQRHLWLDGWTDRDYEIWKDSGLEIDEYLKIRQKILK